MTKFVIFWVRPPGPSVFAGGHDWETFDYFTDAKKTLQQYAACYPWNDYYLAEVCETRTKTVEKQPMPVITIINSGSGYTGPPVGITDRVRSSKQ